MKRAGKYAIVMAALVSLVALGLPQHANAASCNRSFDKVVPPNKLTQMASCTLTTGTNVTNLKVTEEASVVNFPYVIRVNGAATGPANARCTGYGVKSAHCSAKIARCCIAMTIKCTAKVYVVATAKQRVRGVLKCSG